MISFPVHDLPTTQLDAFLFKWQEFGRVREINATHYELQGAAEEKGLLALSAAEVSFEGVFSEDAIALIEEFAAACRVSHSQEPQVFQASESTGPKVRQLPPFLALLGCLLLIPLAIVVLPVLILFGLFFLILNFIRLTFLASSSG